MAGDYKSHLVRTSTMLAFGTIWVLQLQCLFPYSRAGDVSFHTYLSVANDDNWSMTDVFFDTRLEAKMAPATTCKQQQNDARENWSSSDRQQLQCLSKNTKKSCPKCIQNSITKTSKKVTVPTGGICLHADNKCCFDEMCDDDDFRRCAFASCNTQGLCKCVSNSLHSARMGSIYDFRMLPFEGLCYAGFKWQSKNCTTDCMIQTAVNHKNKNQKAIPKYPNPLWTLIAFVTILSELFHAIIAQEVQRETKPVIKRRVANGCNLVQGGFWTFVLRVLFLFWLLWFARVWGFRCEPLAPGFDPTHKLCKRHWHKSNKHSRKLQSRIEKFDVKVDVLCHGVESPLHINRIVGDGNCYWRAVAKQTCMSWYKLKSRTIRHMMQHALKQQDEELCQKVKILSKKNEWANMLAILGTAAYLQRDIRICVRGHIIKCSPQHMHTCIDPPGRYDDRAINIHFENSHYNGIDSGDVERRLKAATHEFSSSLREFLSLPLGAYPKDATMLRHRINPVGRNWATSSRHATRLLSHPSSRRFARVGQMPPQYRPAGQGLPKRRPNEDIASQIMRVAKAKSVAPDTVVPLMKAIPKIPPRPPVPPRRVPKEPSHPPPGYEIPQPMTPPKSPMTPPKPPCPRRNTSMATSWSTSSENKDAATSSETPATLETTRSSTRSLSAEAISKPPEPTTKPLIATAIPIEDRVQHPRLVRKPRTPPPPRRHMPSSAPPVVELPPAVEDMSGGECTEDSVNETSQHAPLDALVDRVVDEVSRRVLERFASAPYMVGLPENAVCDSLKLPCCSHDTTHEWDEKGKLSSNMLRNRIGRDMQDSIAAVPINLYCTSTDIKMCRTQNTNSFLHRLYSGIFGLSWGSFDGFCCFGLVWPWFVWDSGLTNGTVKNSRKIVSANGLQGSKSKSATITKHNPSAAAYLRNEDRERPVASVRAAVDAEGGRPAFKAKIGFGLAF